MNKIVELVIDFENLEFDDLGVEIMSFVDKPAIDVGWMAFSEEVPKEFNEDEWFDAILKLAQSDDYGVRLDENPVILMVLKRNSPVYPMLLRVLEL